MTSQSSCLKTLLQVLKFAEGPEDAVPKLETKLLSDIDEILGGDAAIASEDIQYIIATLLIYSRKEQNMELVIKEGTYKSLEKRMISDIDIEDKLFIYFLDFTNTLLNTGDAIENMFSDQTIELINKIIISGNKKILEKLCGLLSIKHNKKYLQKFYAEHTEIIDAIYKELPNDDSYILFKILACMSISEEVRTKLASDGIAEKIMTVLLEKKEAMNNANILFLLSYVVQNEDVALQIIKSDYIEKIFQEVLVNYQDMNVLCLNLHARIINLISTKECFLEYDGFKNENSVEFKQNVISSLKEMGLEVMRGTAKYQECFVESVYSFGKTTEFRDLFIKNNIVDIIYMICATVDYLSPFLDGTCNQLLPLAECGKNGYEISDNFVKSIISVLNKAEISVQPWRFFSYMLFLGLENKHGVGGIISKTLEKASNPDARLFNATIYAAALVYAFVNPTQGNPMLEYVQERFITTIQEQVHSNGGFVDKYSPSNFKEFDFTSELPSGNCKIADYVMQLAPHVLFACFCAAFDFCFRTGNTSNLDIVSQYGYIENYWMDENSRMLDIQIVKFLVILSKKGAVQYISPANAVKGITRALDSVNSEEDFCACCELINEYISIKENKPVFSNLDMLSKIKKLLDTKFKKSEKCCTSVNKILWIIATDPTGKEILTSIQILGNIIEMLSDYKGNESFVHNALKTFWSLIMKTYNRDLAHKQGCIDVIGEIINIYGNRNLSIANSAYTCIKILTQVNDDNVGREIINAHILENAIEAAKNKDQKVSRTALQTIYACFAFSPVQRRADKIYAGLHRLIKRMIDESVEVKEDAQLALKLVRVFSSSELSAGKVVEDRLLESVINIDKRIGKLSATSYELILQVLAKLASRKSAKEYLNDEEVIKLLARAITRGLAHKSDVVIEISVKLIYSYASYDADNMKIIRALKLDKRLSDHLENCKSRSLSRIITKILEGDTQPGLLEFPRTPSRADF